MIKFSAPLSVGLHCHWRQSALNFIHIFGVHMYLTWIYFTDSTIEIFKFLNVFLGEREREGQKTSRFFLCITNKDLRNEDLICDQNLKNASLCFPESLRYLTTSRLFKTLRHKLTRLLNLRSAWGFCSYILNWIFENHNFLIQNCIYFRLFDLYTFDESYYLS